MSQQTTLELDDPAALRMQALEWKIERVGWLCMLAILAAAILGLLGPGPLSHSKARRAGTRRQDQCGAQMNESRV